MHGHPVSKSTRLKKNALKKLSVIAVSIIFAFAFVYAIPQKEAKAFPIAIPAGITIGAGAYTLGALGLAAIIGPANPEVSDEMRAHAHDVWNTSNQATKDAINWTIEQARNAGNSVVALNDIALAYAEAQIPELATAAIKKLNYSDTTGIVGNTASTEIATKYAKINFTNSANDNKYFAKGEIGFFGVTWNATGIYHNLPSGQIKVADSTQALLDAMKTVIAGATTDQEMYAIAASGGLTVIPGATDQMLYDYNQSVSKVREQWESMRDAGLVLPVDSAVPMSAETGEPLTYNPDADTYTGIDGGIYTGNPAWAFPQPVRRVGEIDIPDGIYVDTPVLTGNPTYDDAIIANPAIPKTTTNINTGTTYPNPKFPTSPVKPTDPTPKPLPRIPGSGSPVPIAIFLVFFDLLRAILMYLVRMFNWIVTIPTVQPIPIDNPYFQWFRHAKILGVYPYTLVMSLATFFLGFSLVKSIRRFLP